MNDDSQFTISREFMEGVFKSQRASRERLESNILQAVREFEKDTGLSVVDISVTSAQYLNGPMTHSVKVEARLNGR